DAEAIAIIARVQVGGSRNGEAWTVRPVVDSSKRVYEYFRAKLQDLPHEEFWVIYLNTACKVVESQLIGRGGNDFTPVDVRVILRYALQCNAHSMILVHNHPSGSLQPSQADRTLTRKVCEAATAIDIKVNDHLIFTDTSYYSFRDEGLL